MVLCLPFWLKFTLPAGGIYVGVMYFFGGDGGIRVRSNKTQPGPPHMYGSPGGPDRDFVFIFHFSLFIFYVSVFVFYLSGFVLNVLVFTSSFSFSVLVLVLVFILSFSVFVFNVLIFTPQYLGFYNVLFLADVLRVLMYEFTYDQPTSRKGVEKQAHTVAGRGGSHRCRKDTKCSHTLGHRNYNINNFKKNKCYTVLYLKTRAKIF